MNNTVVFFAKFFKPVASEEASNAMPRDTTRVVFLDTPVTPELVNFVRSLLQEGIEVHVRDHHLGEGQTPAANETLKELLGESAHIVRREEAPGCPMLVEVGEFSDSGTFIIADPDLDGLTTAMKAVGITYEGLDEDAAVLDVGPLQSEDTLSEIGWYLCRAWRALPEQRRRGPNPLQHLFLNFVDAVQGSPAGRAYVNSRLDAYEQVVTSTKRILRDHVEELSPGIFLVDNTEGKQIDHTLLMQALEHRGAIVYGVIHTGGTLGRRYGEQISVYVVYSHNDTIDLRTLIPEGTPSTTDSGVFYNVSFLIHVTRDWWETTVLPSLQARFGHTA